MNFFTADSHFSYNDLSVLSRDYRPFENLNEMNKKIIDIWNEQINENDIIYHLGDFVNYNYIDLEGFEERLNFVKKIKAKVILILGNNEKRIMNNLFENDFEKFRNYLISLGFKDVICDSLFLKIGENEYNLTHEPSKCNKLQKNLFGHIHSTCFVKKYGFNVGVDNHYFKLFSELNIVELENRRKYFDENIYD